MGNKEIEQKNKNINTNSEKVEVPIKWVMGKATQEQYKDEFNKFASDISTLGIDESIARVLYNRDINTYDKVKKHLFMELKDTHNPALFKDSDKFIEAIKRAIDEKHKVIIMGDYDVDGVTGTSIAMLGLRNLGIDVDFYMNNRFVEGYGFKPESLDAILELHPDVKTIITVDNGIVSFDAVEKAVEKGIQVVVTDHHETKADGTLPCAFAVINHKRRDCEYPFKHLSGAGVIFKMMLLLYWELEEDLDYIYDMLDILAVSTVADIVSLTDENRVFVKEGLRLLREEHRLFFSVLNELMELTTIDEETIGFKYSPAINAIGRLDGCPADIVRAIISDDYEYVREVCARMIARNEDRKEYTAKQTEQAEEMLLSETDRDAFVLHNETFKEGIVGLIAGKICERYFVPSIALTTHNGIIKGSARSTPLINIKEGLDYCADLLEGYGGHAQAAGLSLKPENLIPFKKRLNEYVRNKMEGVDKTKTVLIDSKLEPHQINGDTVDLIDKLRPYGQDFPKPIFGYKTRVMEFNRDIKGNVLKIVGFNNIAVLGFDNKKQYIELGEPNGIAVLGCPAINVFGHRVSYQFMINENNLKPQTYLNNARA